MLHAIFDQRRGHHYSTRPCHHRLDYLDSAMNAAGNREIRLDVTEYDRDPMQPQQHLLWPAQRKAGHDLERFQIEVRLVKTIEQHESVGTRSVEAFSHVRRSTEEGR